MAPKIENYNEIELKEVTIRSSDLSVRYRNKPLYIQTPVLSFKRFTKDDDKCGLLQVSTKKDNHWNNFIVKLESRILEIFDELDILSEDLQFKRSRKLTLDINKATQIKSANLIDLKVGDLKDTEFRAIISVVGGYIDSLKSTEVSIKYRMFTAKTTTEIESLDEEPSFTVEDLKDV